MIRNILVTGSAAIVVFASGLAFAAEDKGFVKEAIQGDNSEIELGQLAADKGGSQGVKEFGQTLVTDHRKGKIEALAVANKLGVTGTDEVMPEAAAEKKRLEGLSGAAFDKEFASYMVKDHKEDIEKFQKQADSGSSDTGDLARKTLPTLQKHLRMAEKLDHST
jgi:putative membrane protein